MTTTASGTQTPHWTQRVVYSFDIESTSPNPLEAILVSATIVKLVGGEYVDERGWFADPGMDIPQEAIDVHGITNEWIREHGRKDRKAVIEEIVAMLAAILKSGTPLVVFNSAYDLTMIEQECERHGIEGLRARLTKDQWLTVIDPFVLAKGYEHYWKQEFVKGRNFKLPSLCERYGIPFVESHDATADAIGAGLLAIRLINDDPDLAAKGPQALHRLQRIWRAKMQNSLRQYFDKNGIEHDGVDDGWPLHNALAPSQI